jgi:tRNA-splicing ligase RtcB
VKRRDLEALGIQGQQALQQATIAASNMKRFGLNKRAFHVALQHLISAPHEYAEHPLLGDLARALIQGDVVEKHELREIPYAVWGGENLDDDAHQQMKNACSLPVACGGALMPDAHVGYGLPIGGVLATEGAVIPFAVGVDIACRVKLSVFDIPASEVSRNRDRLKSAIEKNTKFGIGARFTHPKTHPVMDEEWSFSKYVLSLKDIAWRQLGTSGSGNHFVEFGIFSLSRSLDGVPPGEYLALVSHSGSRGSGAKIAHHFSRIAREKRTGLPRRLQHLAWLFLSEEEGGEYWQAMELMGRYASANHFLIHRDVAKAFGGEVILSVENHHNFAWREIHGGREVIVHRKGATPAGKGVLGYIPGTMIDPGFLVMGKGIAASLESCAHGAGRVMSRKAAKQQVTRHALQELTQAHDVLLLDAGLDEAPLAYKDIRQVMVAQSDLVESIGEFFPKVVKMAPEGELPED